MTRNKEGQAPWQSALIDTISDPKELLTYLSLDESLLEEATRAARLFPFKVPKTFVDRMEKGNPNDPLLLQILPLGMELKQTPGFVKDPLKEASVNPTPGLLHKYHGRVLITFRTACSLHCRYCFRRHFPYEDNHPRDPEWSAILSYLKKDPSITEVILSGGDPLMAKDSALKQFTDLLNDIPPIKRLRIHSRIPIVIPERITDSFITWLKELKQKPVLITHCNHPHEINSSVIEAMHRLAENGVLLLNQAVLLKGINDTLPVQIALSERLFEAGIMPYYLHLLDKVEGAAHFDTPLEKALALHEALSHHLPGYLIPKLVKEEAGKPSKTPLSFQDFYTAL